MPKSREKAIRNAKGRIKAVKSGKLAKIKRRVRELLLGSRAHKDKFKGKGKGAKKIKTGRTKDLEDTLKKSGLDAATIRRLRGGKG